MNQFVEKMVNLAVMKLQNDQGGQLTPFQQNCVDILKNNDAEKGIQLANNLCSSMGKSQNDLTSEAMKFFGI